MPDQVRRRYFKVPQICNFSITPGFSEYIVKKGFMVRIGENRKPVCRIYLPTAWSGSVMFAVREDINAAESAVGSSKVKHTGKQMQTVTADPFSNQNLTMTCKQVSSMVKYRKDRNGNRCSTELKYVNLPAGWVGKNIIAVRALTNEEVGIVAENFKTIVDMQTDMYKTAERALTKRYHLGKTLMIGGDPRQDLADFMKTTDSINTARVNISKVSPGMSSRIIP